MLDANALRRLWPEILDVVKLTSRRTRALLETAQITAVNGELVTLSASGALAKMISDESNTSVLRAALTKVVGGDWKISVDDAAAAAAGEATGSRPRHRRPKSPTRATTSTTNRLPRDGAAAPQHDPEAEAMKLLRDQLGCSPDRQLNRRASRLSGPGTREFPRQPQPAIRWRPEPDDCSAASPALRMLPSSRKVAGRVARFSPARSLR